jgi:hypothetical protein
MRSARILRFAMAAAILIAALTAAPVQQASAMQRGGMMTVIPDKAPPGFDHILCYVVQPASPFPSVNVTLTDQFYRTPFPATLGQTTTACTPAKKKLISRQPLKGFKPNGHFVCYLINQPPPSVGKTTIYNNQLERNATLWGQPLGLCVPTYKIGSGPPPTTYTHLMVYDTFFNGITFTNPLPATTVTLYDQFFTRGFTTTLGNPYLLLTPTLKHYSHPRPVSPNGHWVVYNFTSPPPVQQPRGYINQLEKNSLVAFFPNFLFVPTFKYPPHATASQ